MKYGDLPKVIDTIEIDCKEMMFYQDMLIKEKNTDICKIEPRLCVFSDIIRAAIKAFENEFGEEAYKNSYMYISAKRLFQVKGKPFNRPGWHSDGFMSSDINYIWSDDGSTVFNNSDFVISQDDSLSLKEFQIQADPDNDVIFPPNTLLRLNQYNIHRVGEVLQDGLRTFVKVSFSTEKYDLEGNSHNYGIDYDWKMRARKLTRNIPQSETIKS
ncbi:hypothetical protein [Elizabethkingia anophelis]|uniref:hypothetical protein n=1 Tax=Elizabethkingia anophelis TaxID=1117645 RepID=UPI000DDABAFF|nr:hypothetical protein [Elizabethkingia anophelis]MDV3555212.1 hypothetical protein [Elizabethkingia anophelis]MDV3653237.1 hypothetical protein [Elizabethkingia anophelis]RBA36130.1 hypothetical protein DSC50_01925 [Elizabethkingia anophelis]